jgi:phenylacetate-CoA ligase
MRREIEDAFDMHAVDIYGLSEVMGPGVANECVETKDGLHIWEDHFYPEIVDPSSGNSLPDGQSGELLFTSLTKEAFPLIRYRTRDLTTLRPGTARSMRRMDKVTGRSDDMIILRGVNVFPTQIEEQILSVKGLAPHFQLELTKSGRLDEMTVHVEKLEGYNEPDLGLVLTSKIKDIIGVTAKVEVKKIGEIPRSEGKAVRIVDNRVKR